MVNCCSNTRSKGCTCGAFRCLTGAFTLISIVLGFYGLFSFISIVPTPDFTIVTGLRLLTNLSHPVLDQGYMPLATNYPKDNGDAAMDNDYGQMLVHNVLAGTLLGFQFYVHLLDCVMPVVLFVGAIKNNISLCETWLWYQIPYLLLRLMFGVAKFTLTDFIFWFAVYLLYVSIVSYYTNQLRKSARGGKQTGDKKTSPYQYPTS